MSDSIKVWTEDFFRNISLSCESSLKCVGVNEISENLMTYPVLETGDKYIIDR